MILVQRVPDTLAGRRLDEILVQLFPDHSRQTMRRVIDWGGCAIDGICCRVASRTLSGGEEITVGIMEQERCIDLHYTSDDMLYEDDDYLAVNKESGVNSQRTPYQLKGTVEFAVSCYLRRQGIAEPARVVHRLDRGTSGVIFFPKNRRSATHISTLLRDGKVEKVYWALTRTVPSLDEWVVDLPIGKVSRFRYGVDPRGKPATTRFRVICTSAWGALVEAHPLTGRTHQIRVHLEHSGYPVLGDTPYGGVPAPRLMLHCRRMAFRSQRGKDVAAEAPLDRAFTDLLTAWGIDAE
ncbi:MAG: RluA family pseudouridine synthase [Desulfuromonadia bacterium]